MIRSLRACSQLPAGSRDVSPLTLSDHSGIVVSDQFILKGESSPFIRCLKGASIIVIEWYQVYLCPDILEELSQVSSITGPIVNILDKGVFKGNPPSL